MGLDHGISKVKKNGKIELIIQWRKEYQIDGWLRLKLGISEEDTLASARVSVDILNELRDECKRIIEVIDRENSMTKICHQGFIVKDITEILLIPQDEGETKRMAYDLQYREPCVCYYIELKKTISNLEGLDADGDYGYWLNS